MPQKVRKRRGEKFSLRLVTRPDRPHESRRQDLRHVINYIVYIRQPRGHRFAQGTLVVIARRATKWPGQSLSINHHPKLPPNQSEMCDEKV